VEGISQQHGEETALPHECEHVFVVFRVVLHACHGARSSMCTRTVPAPDPRSFGAAGHPGAAESDAAGCHACGV